MSSALNVITIGGRLGSDAESKQTQGGSFRLSFSIANSRKYKDKDGDLVEDTSWVQVSYYGKGAEAIEEYLVKGKEVIVVGRLNTYSYEDKEGNKRRGAEVVANQVILCGGGKRDEDEEGSSKPSKAKSTSKRSRRADDDDDEDAPW